MKTFVACSLTLAFVAVFATAMFVYATLTYDVVSIAHPIEIMNA